jgi:hypothetical protein
LTQYREQHYSSIGSIQVNPELRVAWANLLNRYKFTWFATLTWRTLPKTYTALNQTKKWLTAIEKEEKRNIGYYLCLEWTKLQNRPHVHLLMGNLGEVRRDKWWLTWYTRHGAARILPYRAELGCAHYLAKYVLKDIYQRATFEIKGLARFCYPEVDLKK